MVVQKEVRLHLEDVTHDAHNRLLFRLPKPLLLPSAHATSADCGRAWRRGRLSSISYSRTHEDCRQPADDDRMQEQEQIRGRRSATVDQALQGRFCQKPALEEL